MLRKSVIEASFVVCDTSLDFGSKEEKGGGEKVRVRKEVKEWSI